MVISIAFYKQEFVLLRVRKPNQKYYYTFAVKSLIYFQFVIGVNNNDEAFCIFNPSFETLDINSVSKEDVLQSQYDWSTFLARKYNNRSGLIFRFNLEQKYKLKNKIPLEGKMVQGLRIATKNEAKLLEKEIVRTLAGLPMKNPALNLLMIESNNLLTTYIRMCEDGEIERIV